MELIINLQSIVVVRQCRCVFVWRLLRYRRTWLRYSKCGCNILFYFHCVHGYSLVFYYVFYCIHGYDSLIFCFVYLVSMDTVKYFILFLLCSTIRYILIFYFVDNGYERVKYFILLFPWKLGSEVFCFTGSTYSIRRIQKFVFVMSMDGYSLIFWFVYLYCVYGCRLVFCFVLIVFICYTL